MAISFTVSDENPSRIFEVKGHFTIHGEGIFANGTIALQRKNNAGVFIPVVGGSYLEAFDELVRAGAKDLFRFQVSGSEAGLSINVEVTNTAREQLV